MAASLLAVHILTANIVFKGFVAGLSFALVAMGIVLVYRSSRIINFAVGDLGVPATALLGLYVAKSHWPYFPALIFALLVGTLSGTVIELVVIRRLFKAPRVIVLVATIGIAELARGVTLAIPQYRTGKFQSQFPTPISSEWKIGSITVTGPQLVVLIVVPIIALFLWWLLGHALRRRRARVRDERRPRAPDRYQPEADVDRDLDDRRFPLDDVGDPLRNPARLDRARLDWT